MYRRNLLTGSAGAAALALFLSSPAARGLTGQAIAVE